MRSVGATGDHHGSNTETPMPSVVVTALSGEPRCQFKRSRLISSGYETRRMTDGQAHLIMCSLLVFHLYNST
jgi:hypothetical protein